MYYLYAYDTVESGIKQLHLIERTVLLFSDHSNAP